MCICIKNSIYYGIVHATTEVNMNNNYITVIDIYMFYRRCKLTQNWKISCLFRMIILTKKGFPLFNKSTFGELYLNKITWQSWYVFLLVIYHWKWNVQYKRKIALLLFFSTSCIPKKCCPLKHGGKKIIKNTSSF